MLFLPISSFKKSKKCERCGLRYPKSEAECTHCSGLANGRALDDLLMKKESENQGNQSLGLMFLLLGAGLAFGLMVLVLL